MKRCPSDGAILPAFDLRGVEDGTIHGVAHFNGILFPSLRRPFEIKSVVVGQITRSQGNDEGAIGPISLGRDDSMRCIERPHITDLAPPFVLGEYQTVLHIQTAIVQHDDINLDHVNGHRVHRMDWHHSGPQDSYQQGQQYDHTFLDHRRYYLPRRDEIPSINTDPAKRGNASIRSQRQGSR